MGRSGCASAEDGCEGQCHPLDPVDGVTRLGLDNPEVEKATQDPATNVYIAWEYLAQLKAESSFADVPPDQMTPAQYQELAARYNGGPGWQTNDAQAYGRGFSRNIDDARQALGD
ncbi:hypothetical protein OG883_33570 [Streptomyces sp. NBC_01142]|uniref:hypothetical protein n=1 Tax=Streptomyces sp. NBC_01142 TaxID=2975865 RepID=UPI002253AB78|nr:hypothetical protein [Streptomyces sp. NBC_01142]MCX4824701.1 hypothetical protein [Streptomyces sp. NBC_01142]